MDSPDIQWPSGNAYLVGDRGTEALGVKDIAPAIPEVIVSTLNFETDPIPGVGGGNLPWLTTTSSPHTGSRCFRSGAIANNQQSLWTFTVPATAIVLRLWWRVSSESGFDFLEIYKDSVSVPNRILQQSGTGNVWTQATLNIAGATSIIIRYVKDGSSSAGLDTVFVDDFEWISVLGVAAVQNYEPLHLDTQNRLKVTMLDTPVAVTGDFQRPLDCDIDSVTICTDGPLQVEVLNFSPPVTGTRFLACETDSVTVCTDDPLQVEVLNFPPAVTGSRFLDCETDSVSVCIDEPLQVQVLNFPPPVTGVFQVQIIDEPVAVTGTVAVSNQPKQYVEDTQAVSGDLGYLLLAQRHDPNTGTVDADNDYSALHVNQFGQLKVTVGNQVVEFKHPGVPGTVVTGSRWQVAAAGTIGTAPLADSPIPTANQRIIVDWIECACGVGVSLGLVLTTPAFQIVNTDGAPATIYWAATTPLPILAGGSTSFENTPIIMGGQGERLRIRQAAAISIVISCVAFGGYIVDV